MERRIFYNGGEGSLRRRESEKNKIFEGWVGKGFSDEEGLVFGRRRDIFGMEIKKEGLMF